MGVDSVNREVRRTDRPVRGDMEAAVAEPRAANAAFGWIGTDSLVHRGCVRRRAAIGDPDEER